MTDPSPLERSYRRLLVAFPRSWRQHRAEEVLAVLLADADRQNRSRATLPDVIDLLSSGLRARAGLVAGVIPIRVRELAALLALAAGTAFSIVALVVGESRVFVSEHAFTVRGTIGPFLTLGIVLYFGWLTACAAALVGLPRVGRVAGWLTLIATLAAPLAAREFGVNRPPMGILIVLALWAGVALAGPPMRERRQRATLAASVLVMTATLAQASYAVLESAYRQGDFSGVTDPDIRLMFYRGWAAHAFAEYAMYGIAVAVGVGFLAPRGRRYVRGAAVLLAASPWILYWAALQASLDQSHGREGIVAPAVVGMLVLVIIAAVFAAGLRLGQRNARVSAAD